MAKFAPPSPLNFAKPQSWPEWRQRFLRYRTATKLNAENGDVQVSTLVYAMGPEAESAFRTFQFAADAEKTNFDIVLTHFDSYFAPRKNVIHERAMFNTRCQRAGESAEAFIRTLHEMAETCDFGQQKHEHIRDRIVTGLLDRDLSRDLQLKSDLDLHTAVEMVKQREAVKAQITAQGNLPSVQGAGALEEVRRPYKPPDKRATQNTTGAKSSGPRCTRCNYQHSGRKCPAKGQRCRKCGGADHFQACCKKTKKLREVASAPIDQVHQMSGISLATDDVYYLGEVENITDTADPWWITLPVCDEPVTFKIDPGADVSVLSVDTYESLSGAPELTPPDTKLTSVGAPIACHGTFSVTTRHGDREYQFKAYVVEGRSNLLGRSAACAMGLVKLTVDELERPRSIIKGPPVHITLCEGQEPYNVLAPRRLPFPLLPKVSKKLKYLVETDVIMPVDEPTDWCAPIVVAPKRNSDDIRLCVDLRRLNRAVKRERYVLPTLDDLAAKLEGCTHFTKLDAKDAYHQLLLDEESRKLTTFITPIGRFCFKRLPFGISSASEIFQRRIADIVADEPKVAVNQDDILVGGVGERDHDERAERVQAKLGEAGVEFNMDKCEFKVKEVVFHGHKFSKDGMSPDPAKVDAINNMPPPTNVTELRRVLGMANWLGAYVPHLATVTQPLNRLLKTDSEWVWGNPQQEAFQQMKQLLTTSPVLAYYDPAKPTTVMADASSYGLGAVLMQQHGERSKPVAYASRTLTPCEQRYAQIEKELLSITWACDKFRRYLVGLPVVQIVTDHKPLVPIINDKDLDVVPIRCQRMLMRLMEHNCHAEYMPGKDLTVPDALSRSPLKSDPSELSEISEHSSYVPASDAIVEQIQKATATDPVIQSAMQYTLSGWPQHVRGLPSELHKYHAERAHLSVAQGMLLYNNRMVVPAAMREVVLGKIHDGHMGLTKCRSRAQQTVWWPGLSADITMTVKACEFCQIHKPTQRAEPMISTPLPESPWQRIAADLCDHRGQNYLIITDYYSRYIEIIHMTATRSHDVIMKMKTVFARWGIPMELVSDNGPQFASHEFQQFAAEYGFHHHTSSPRYPQSNGAAERAVQIAKHILDQPDPIKSLMVYRATPSTATGYSPAQLLMGRNIRDSMPATANHLQPRWPLHVDVQRHDDAVKSQNQHYYDQRHGARPLPPLKPGDLVRVKDEQQAKWSSPMKVKGTADTPRSYRIETPHGLMRRNRRHLQLVPAKPPSPTKSCEDTAQRDRAPTYDVPLQMPPPAPPPLALPLPPLETVTSSGGAENTRRSGRRTKPVDRLDL